jgi:hypothetical protein
MSIILSIEFTDLSQLQKYHAQINQIKGLILGAMANDKNAFYDVAFDSFEKLIVKPINETMEDHNIMSPLMHK